MLAGNPLVLFALGDDLVHMLLVMLSTVLLAIAILAYVRRRTGRYLFLTVAFLFLALSQTITLFETFNLSDTLIVIPLVNIHLSHLFDMFMLVSFALALLVRDEIRRSDGL